MIPFKGEVYHVSRFHLHLITDTAATADLPGAVAAALAGGVDCVQVRAHHLPARSLYDLAMRIRPDCTAAGAGLLVGDRIDVALAAGATGAHLGGRSLSVTAARPLLVDRLLGVSVHSIGEALAAAEAGADYVTFGHIFPTRSHLGQPAAGPDLLARVVQAVEIPVLAIGGISPANLDSVLATGCAGVAVISAILASASPLQAAAELRRALDSSQHRPRIPIMRSLRL